MAYKKKICLFLGFTLSVMLIFSCGQSEKDSDDALSGRVKSLQKQVDQLKPGFGDVMLGIQTHHAKLWFAGINKNWELADFELGEIEENIEKIETLYPNDDRTKDLSLLDPKLNSLAAAINAKQVDKFKKEFSTLTNTCNDCHQKNGVAFNVITIPDHPPVPNQKFKVEN